MNATTDVLANALPFLLAGFPEALIDATARSRLMAPASILPAVFAFNTVGLECPLHVPACQADLLVCAQRRRNGALALCRSPASPGASHHPAWGAVRGLGHMMRAQTTSAFDDVWLEFDVAGPAPTTPNLFAGPANVAATAEARTAQVVAIAPLLTGAPLSSTLAHGIGICMQALPPAARVFQVGAMRARAAPGLRLCINTITLDGIIDFLVAIQHPGDIDAVRSWGSGLQGAVVHVALALDITPAPQPKIGLECYFSTSEPPATSLHPFLEKLDAAGGVTAAKCAALRHFSISRITPDQKAMPDTPTALAGMLQRHRRCVFRSALHHIKLILQPDRPVEAKAYFAIRQAWTGGAG